MLETSIALGDDAQQFLSPLLLHCTHMLFKHLAMQSALPLMLEAFEFDTLETTSQNFVQKNKAILTAESSGILESDLAG